MSLQMNLASSLAFALLHSLWQVALIAFIAALAFAALSGATARLRHAVGMVCLLAMAAAPVVTFALYWQSALSEADAAFGGFGSPGAAGAVAGHGAAVSAPPWQDGLLICLSQVWLVGVLLMALRQAAGWRLLGRIEAQPFVELPLPWQRRATALAGALGITRRVAVRLTRHGVTPFTARAWKPVVWLPLTLLTHLPADQIEALLAHELAHIRRLDWVWNALQSLVETLLFHHPAMWWLSQRIRHERELACDDLAVAVCGDAVVLAEALTALRYRRGLASTPALALAAEGGVLFKRVAHLLSTAPRRANWRTPVALLLLLCGGGLAATQVAPSAHLLVNLRFDSSSAGDLTPGHYREYTASYLAEPQRRYRISMDTQGRVDEVYSEGGRRLPIDGRARAWLQAMAAMSGANEPAAGPPTTTPATAHTRAPAQRPPFSDELLALLAEIGSDSRLIAVTGVPVRFDRQSFTGQVRTWGSRDFHWWGVDDPVGGKADFTMTFEGPHGRARVHYVGRTRHGGVWQADRLEVSPPPD